MNSFLLNLKKKSFTLSLISTFLISLLRFTFLSHLILFLNSSLLILSLFKKKSCFLLFPALFKYLQKNCSLICSNKTEENYSSFLKTSFSYANIHICWTAVWCNAHIIQVTAEQSIKLEDAIMQMHFLMLEELGNTTDTSLACLG